MKHRILIFTMVFALISLSACNSIANNATTAPSTGSTLLESKPTEATRPTTATETQPIETTQPTTEPTEPVEDYSPTRFLTDLNLNGSFYPSDELVPPGTLTKIENIPVYDQDIIGKEVTIVLAGDQLRTSFYYKSGEKERLVLVIGEFNIPLLMILETDLGGIGALYQKIADEEPFSGTVLVAVNISFEEGMYAQMAARSTYEVLDSEQFSFDDGAIPTTEGEYIGLVGMLNNETVRFMKGSQTGDPSNGLQDDFQVFYRIFDRFDLNQYLE